jgi:hypothetical protein
MTTKFLITGPSNSGKTRRTAALFEEWIEENGTDGVTILDFAPELERDGEVLGGRFTRATDPGEAWYGAIDAHAPRAESETDREALALAKENADQAATLLDRAPSNPRAVFVNDATIPFQHPDGSLDRLFASVDGAAVVVINAFDSDELGSDDPVSRCEQKALSRLYEWADEHERLR